MTRGRDILLEVLRTEGVRHLFGNPGTTELPLVDALVGADDLEYVLALQEATAVGMADGYAQATGRPAFLNLHTSAGLGNAVGNLTNAQANGTPLVVTAGQQDRRHLHHDPLLGGDLVGLAASVSKWTHETSTLGELGTVLRRAFHDAASAPAGPVFVSIPMDVLEEEGDHQVPPPSQLHRATVPAGLTLERLADRLATAPVGSLAIVAGDEVAPAGVDPLVNLAETLGCRVHGSPLHSTTVFPTDHPLWAGPLAPAASGINATLAAYDTVLLVGGRAFMVYPFTPGPAVPPHVALLHLSPDPAQLGRTWPTDLGVVGDPAETLRALLVAVHGRVDATAAETALAEARTTAEAAAARFDAKALAAYDQQPMAPAAAAHALVRALPPDSVVVDEAITTGSHVRGYHRTARAGRYFFCRGGGLGWGMPAALGVSLGYDREPVLCVVGDGSAMYSPQALWTAARLDLPVTFAVVDNGQYLILKNALRGMGGRSAETGTFVAMDLDRPAIDFPALARSMGVPATSVERAGDVGDAVRAARQAGGPHLLHLPIAAP
ncbi:MAG TPA: thiamine pyrophosphate-binding protein [Acidimicrobiales bacterium]|nr:thiamine pyrophosphate-binding protein [Acidimicrobiales bacterium]